jgi:tRNA(fMet)-specific endonuclease VapC
MVSLIDSSVLIEVERGNLELATLFDRGAESAAMSAITAAELLHGVERLHSSSKVKAAAGIENSLETIRVLPFDLVCARVHARVGADLRRRGVTIGAVDLMIGATALAHGLKVITRDRRSFPRIPSLELELLA